MAEFQIGDEALNNVIIKMSLTMQKLTDSSNALLIQSKNIKAMVNDSVTNENANTMENINKSILSMNELLKSEKETIAKIKAIYERGHK